MRLLFFVLIFFAALFLLAFRCQNVTFDKLYFQVCWEWCICVLGLSLWQILKSQSYFVPILL